MSSLRNLVTGSDVCAPTESHRRSNVVGTLANTLLERTRANERARQGGTASSSSVQNFFENALPSEEQEKLKGSSIPEGSAIGGLDGQTSFAKEFREFQRIFDEASTSHLGHSQERDHVFSQALKHFMYCARDDAPFMTSPFPSHLTFDPLEQQKIGSRVRHLCHVMFADHGFEVAEMQVSRFLESVGIASFPSQRDVFQEAWNEAQPHPASTGKEMARSHDWVDEFTKISFRPDSMPHEGWVSEFAQQQIAQTSLVASNESKEAKDISSALIHQMANDADPKFRNSKFLQFVQKLNSGALVIEGDQVREGRTADQWAAEFASQNAQHGLTNDKHASHPWLEDFKQQDSENWAQEYGSLEGGWLDNSEIQEWVDSYQQMAYGPVEEDKEYVFAAENPFHNNPDALRVAKDLFNKGNLNEAVLAAEAATQRNAEAWFLLGKIHAENDNDTQAIAALNRAHGVDPSNQNVLLDLGVCHANELHEEKTVEALTDWLRQNPQYRSLPVVHTKPPDPSQSLSHAMQVFHRVVAERPSDADVLIALGVLHHLGRNYEEAISLFQSATRLRPEDYTLWNKLGATQANAARSGEAIASYQRSLEQKPNYMRGWANLGISYANVGDYVSATKHYVRALSLNGESDTVWGYLKSSAICAGFTDVLDAIDARDLDLLNRRFSF